jgi:hypothetical protein
MEFYAIHDRVTSLLSVYSGEGILILSKFLLVTSVHPAALASLLVKKVALEAFPLNTQLTQCDAATPYTPPFSSLNVPPCPLGAQLPIQAGRVAGSAA